jgi:glycosyltransferase involved in cell wall biosynthesis
VNEGNGRRARRVDQVLPWIESADAISNYALQLRDHLRERGYASDIWVEARGSAIDARARAFEPHAVARANAILYHHSIGTELTELVAALDVPKALIYHNVTPPAFYADYRPALAYALEAGAGALPAIAAAFDRVIAVSDYNAAGLRAAGMTNVETIPVIVDAGRFGAAPAAAALREGDAAMRWLFVGRIAPNKGLRRLIEVAGAFRRGCGAVRLTIVGRSDTEDPYLAELHALVAELDLEGAVRFAGVLSDAALAQEYRNADVLVTLSEHEGFCVPLVEAMFFDLPVVALAAAAIPETLGAAGLLIDPAAGVAEIAAVLLCLRDDPALRAAIVAAQRARRDDFSPARVWPQIDRLVEALAS